MKYFAKYLPVEGEIKEGYCLDILKNEVIYYNGNYGEEIPKELKKVKLFLCSRGITKGDKIRGEYPSTLGFDVECLRNDDKSSSVPHWVVRGQDNNEYFYAKQDSFKVIGEISPDAAWVKEGDEFEFLKDCWISNSEIGRLDTYKIKGSCGHYH